MAGQDLGSGLSQADGQALPEVGLTRSRRHGLGKASRSPSCYSSFMVGLGHPNLEATTRTARGHGHIPRTPACPCRSDLLLWDLNFCRRADICSQVSQPVQSHLQHVFSPQLPKLSAPSEDRQGSGSCRNLPGRTVPPSRPPAWSSFPGPCACPSQPGTHLQVQAQLSALCSGGRGGSCPIKAWRGWGVGSDPSVTSF